ncbi:MAG: tRNA-specific 2-thiouridylase, partial [Neolewinella sp.]
YDKLPDTGMELLTKVRYKDSGTLSLVEQIGDANDRFAIDFYAEVRGVAPGQSAVFYEGDDVVGGGLIHASR